MHLKYFLSHHRSQIIKLKDKLKLKPPLIYISMSDQVVDQEELYAFFRHLYISGRKVRKEGRQVRV